MKKNDWKDRLNVVYSTNPDFGYEMDNDEEQVTLDKDKQNLRVSIDKKNRGGKVVTLITGFVGTENDLKELGKLLKSKCGVGGSAKDGEIIIQGDFKTKVMELLVREGYTKTKGTLFCAAALFSLLSFAQNDKGDIVKTGDKMPAFTLTSTVNGTVNSADLKGKVVLINIFATWCGPCQSELAEVQKTLWPKYKDNKDFRMIVIGREHTDEELTAYNKRKEFTFPLYPDPKREVTNKFASQYIPRSYLINKEGKVISATVGYQKEEMDKLMKEIDKALK